MHDFKIKLPNWTKLKKNPIQKAAQCYNASYFLSTTKKLQKKKNSVNQVILSPCTVQNTKEASDPYTVLYMYRALSETSSKLENSLGINHSFGACG